VRKFAEPSTARTTIMMYDWDRPCLHVWGTMFIGAWTCQQYGEGARVCSMHSATHTTSWNTDTQAHLVEEDQRGLTVPVGPSGFTGPD
jgi:hypothetical protein